jgi:hypothetical protein
MASWLCSSSLSTYAFKGEATSVVCSTFPAVCLGRLLLSPSESNIDWANWYHSLNGEEHLNPHFYARLNSYAARPSPFRRFDFNVFNSPLRLSQRTHSPPVTDQRFSKRSIVDWVCHAMRELEIGWGTGLKFGASESDVRSTPMHLSRSIYCFIQTGHSSV